MPKVGFISFRLGGTDGVSVVSDQWIRAFTSLGYEITTIAGQGPVEHLIPSLGLDSVDLPSRVELRQALEGLDLVVVENLLSLPLRLEASLLVAEALQGRRAILHHHDLAWQRSSYRHITELPPHDPNWLHVTITHKAAEQFADRGIATTTIWNSFTPPTRLGERQVLRDAMGIADNEILALHPVRAIERKNIAGALKFCEEIDATYWLQGEVEEGYEAALADILAQARTKVIHSEPTDDLGDAYAACDLVMFPSHHEGFGNPPFEAALHRRRSVVANYSVLKELSTTGIQFLDVNDPEAALEAARSPNRTIIDHNEQIVRTQFSPERLRKDLQALLAKF